MKKAEELIKEHRKVLDVIAKRLIVTETIEQKEFNELLVANGITPKTKKEVENMI
jgi:ATP-dependent Zn protease